MNNFIFMCSKEWPKKDDGGAQEGGVSEQFDCEPFNPKEELKKIRAVDDPVEKRERFAEYKKQLFEQKIEILDLINDLVAVIEENPDVESATLRAIVSSRAAALRLDPKQLRLFEKFIQRYRKCHRIIERYQQQDLKPQVLYRNVVGQDPIDDIEIVFRPLNIVLQFNNFDDFYKFVCADYKGEPPSKEVVRKEVGGLTITNVGISDLLYRVVALSPKYLKKGSEDEATQVLSHEETHVARSTLVEMDPRVRFGRYDKLEGDLNNLAQSGRVEASYFKKKFWQLIKQDIDIEIDQLGEEFIAFYQQGGEASVVCKALLEGVTYWPRIKNIMASETQDWLKILGPNSAYLAYQREEYLNLHIPRRINEMRQAVEVLERAGYSRQEIFALLMTEPTHKWLNWAYRLKDIDRSDQ